MTESVTPPAKQGSSLSAIALAHAATSRASKADVSSPISFSGGGGAGGTPDRGGHGEKKQQQQFSDFSEAVSARLHGFEKQQGGLESKVDGLASMLQQFLAAQQLQGAGTATASATTSKNAGATETKGMSSSAYLSAMQEKRLAAAKESNAGIGAKVLDLSKEEQRIISSALESKVSHTLGSFAGSAGSSSAEQTILDHHLELLRRDQALQAKMSVLGQAKSYPELTRRLFKLIVSNASDKVFCAFMENHIVMLADYNDTRSWNAAKFYHYEVFDQLAQRHDDSDKADFYRTNVNGHASLIGKVMEKFQPRSQRQQQQHGNRGGRGRGGNRGGDSFRGNRGGGRGGGRGSSSSSPEASLV
jgi:hypothetical protein